VKRAAKMLIWVAGIYVVVVLGSGLLIKALLTSGRIDAVMRSLNARMPVAVSVAEGSFDLKQWFRFQPVIQLRKVSVTNPAGFSTEPLLAVAEAGAQVDLFSLFGRDLRVQGVDLREPVLNIETDRRGNTNVAALLAAAAKGRQGTGGGTSPSRGVSIDRVSLTGGTIRYLGQGNAPRLTVRDIELSLSDLGAGRTAKVVLGARLFGRATSRLDFKGQVGPAGAASLPAQGTLSLLLAPVEIPKALREQYLGEVAGEPPPQARVTFTAQMQGDLMNTLAGTGALQFTDFAVGRSKDTRLPLSGTAPFRVSLESPLGSPAVDVSAASASLQLGQGRWKGSLSARYDGSRLAGQSSGSITGVRIEQMLRAFTTTKDSVSGLAEIPEYRLQFAGMNAMELRNSLAGGGEISLRDGKIALFDLLGSIETKLQGALGGETGKQGTTNFLKLTSRFQIAHGQVTLPDLVLQSPSSSVGGQGYFKFDHALSFDLTTDVAGGLAARFNGRPDAAGVAHLRVPVKVRGTLESPKVYPDVAGMAKAVAVEKAKGLIDSFLKRRGAGQPK
jgi:uncharacterized protein involved in outer membrane biogenesis